MRIQDILLPFALFSAARAHWNCIKGEGPAGNCVGNGLDAGKPDSFCAFDRACLTEGNGCTPNDGFDSRGEVSDWAS
ncbi:hypothetical protein Slin15195_G010000 [Septoria linicola]|uniref:Uncharacterized protein n=1 Tax=Septoria linicola TaxID=215465 RepID=A0A9Q9AMV8_9PEZI|nr:hypothetical protein Slin15195_G010000 [Septoria linicola]